MNHKFLVYTAPATNVYRPFDITYVVLDSGTPFIASLNVRFHSRMICEHADDFNLELHNAGAHDVICQRLSGLDLQNY